MSLLSQAQSVWMGSTCVWMATGADGYWAIEDRVVNGKHVYRWHPALYENVIELRNSLVV